MAILENGICLMHCENLNSDFSSATITNNGATVSTDQHKFGSKSLYFNGNSYVSIGIPSQDNYTIEFWAYPTSDNTAGWFPTMVSSTANSNSGGTYMHLDDGSFSLYPVCRVNPSNSEGNYGGYGSTIITRREWHHIAICKSGSSHYFFLDGALIRTVNQSNPNTITAWYIGGLRGSSDMMGGCYYEGYIDEIAISSTCKWTSAFNVPTEAYSAYHITNKIHLGNSNIASVFLGNSAVNKIYLGDNLLYGEEVNK